MRPAHRRAEPLQPAEPLVVGSQRIEMGGSCSDRELGWGARPLARERTGAEPRWWSLSGGGLAWAGGLFIVYPCRKVATPEAGAGGAPAGGWRGAAPARQSRAVASVYGRRWRLGRLVPGRVSLVLLQRRRHVVAQRHGGHTGWSAGDPRMAARGTRPCRTI